MQENAMTVEDKKKWASFWLYFINTWTKIYSPELWNWGHYFSQEDADATYINRTNNPLERYNRKLHEDLGDHPSMIDFVVGLKAQANHFLQELKNIQMLKKSKPVRSDPYFPDIPDSYYSFAPSTISSCQPNAMKRKQRTVD